MRTTWILIANSSTARIFQAAKTTKDMKLICEIDHPESREKAVNLVSDLPGRYRKSSSSPLSVYEEPTNPKQVEVERFAHQLAHELNEGRNLNKYHDLIIIAPAHFQGLLNKTFNTHVKNLITITLDKDYTRLKQHELLNYLDGKIKLKRAA
jgi:protein required for attachment to host cells